MFDRKLLFSVSTVLLLTCYDLNRSYHSQISRNLYSISNDQKTISSIPTPKIKMNRQITPTIKFHYCISCGYENLFKQFSELVRTNYPYMAVLGENYFPGAWKSSFAKALFIIKMALLVCLLFSQNPFLLLNIPTPIIYSLALENKMYTCLMIFFVSNSVESYLVSTGAFEISVNDIPLWSKLQTGRIPSANEFVQMLQPFAANLDLNSNNRHLNP